MLIVTTQERDKSKMATEVIDVVVRGRGEVRSLSNETSKLADNLQREADAFLRSRNAANADTTAKVSNTRATKNTATATGLLGRTVTLIDGPLGGFASRINTARILNEELTNSNNGVIRSLGPFGTVLAVGAIAAIGITAALVSLTRASRALVDQQTKTARALGITTGSLVALQLAAAETAGLTDTQLNTAFGRLERVLGDINLRTNSVGQALEGLGINLNDIQRANPTEQFNQIAEALRGVESASQRASLAQQIFGRSGRALVLTLEQGRQGLDTYRAEAERLGLVLSNEATASIEESNDAVDRVGNSFIGLGNTLAELSAGVITRISNGFSSLTASINGTIRAALGLRTGGVSVAQLGQRFDRASVSVVRFVREITEGRSGLLGSLGTLRITLSRVRGGFRDLLGRAPRLTEQYRNQLIGLRNTLQEQIGSTTLTANENMRLTGIVEDLNTAITQQTDVLKFLEIQENRNRRLRGSTPGELRASQLAYTALGTAITRTTDQVIRARLAARTAELDTSFVEDAVQQEQLRSNAQIAIIRRRAIIERTAVMTLTDEITRLRNTGNNRDATLLQQELDRRTEHLTQLGTLESLATTRTEERQENIREMFAERRRQNEIAAQNVLGTEGAAGGGNPFDIQEEALRQSLERRRDIIEGFRGQNVITEGQYQGALLAIQEDGARQADAIQRARNNAGTSLAANFFGNLATIFETAQGKQTAASRAFAQTENAINTYLSATKAFQALAGIPIVGPVLGGVAAGAAIAAGVQNASRIASAGSSGVTGGSRPRSPSVRVGAFGGSGRGGGSVGFRQLGSGGGNLTGRSVGTVNNNQSITINPAPGTTPEQVAEIGEMLTPLISEISTNGDVQTAGAIMNQFRTNGSMDRR